LAAGASRDAARRGRPWRPAAEQGAEGERRTPPEKARGLGFKDGSRCYATLLHAQRLTGAAAVYGGAGSASRSARGEVTRGGHGLPWHPGVRARLGKALYLGGVRTAQLPRAASTPQRGARAGARPACRPVRRRGARQLVRLVRFEKGKLQKVEYQCTK
jgi:hypothetical protein